MVRDPTTRSPVREGVPGGRRLRGPPRHRGHDLPPPPGAPLPPNGTLFVTFPHPRAICLLRLALLFPGFRSPLWTFYLVSGFSHVLGLSQFVGPRSTSAPGRDSPSFLPWAGGRLHQELPSPPRHFTLTSRCPPCLSEPSPPLDLGSGLCLLACEQRAWGGGW